MASIPDSFSLPQRGGERAAVGDGDGGHGAASLLMGAKTCTGWPANSPRALEPALGLAGALVGGRPGTR